MIFLIVVQISFTRTLASQGSRGSDNKSGGYGGSDKSTTEKVKEKSGEYAQQAKSAANQAADKAREG